MILYSCFHYSERLAQPELSRLLCRVPESVQQKVMRYTRWQDQQTCLFGKLLTRKLLIAFGYDDDCLHRLSVNPYGKPLIDDQVDFNISHSGHMVTIAASNRYLVGIDVEQKDGFPLQNILYFLRPEESERLHQSATSEAFYEFWTRKESLIKAKGMGLHLDLKDIYIQGDRGLFKSRQVEETWYYYSLPSPADYVATLCTQQPGLTPQFVLPDNLFDC